MIDRRLSMCLTRVKVKAIIVLAPAILLLATASHAYSGSEQDHEAPPVQDVVVTDAAEKGSDGFVATMIKSLTDEAHLTVGYGIVQWKMDLKRSTDGATATMVQRDNSALFVSYGTKPNFIKDTQFGYTLMMSYVNFDMNKQDIPGDQFANLGTDVSGYLFYAVPTLYYQWGEHRYKGRFVRLGLGVGVGAASYSGTVRLSTGEVVHTGKKNYEPRLTVSNFLEARWNHIGISFSYASPRIYGDGYDIRVSGISANIGFTYYF